MQEVVVNYYSNEKLPFFLSKAYGSTPFYMLAPLNKHHSKEKFAKFCCIEASFFTSIKI